jgi:hypothetical protein
MRIDSSGNVGIGTTSPAERLHVVGKIAVTGTNPSIRQTVQNSQLDLCGGTTVGTDPAIQIVGSTTTSDANKIFYNANTHLFRTSSGGTTYATIDSSGNLGVGTTSPANRLSIGAGSFASATSQTTGMYTNGTSGLVMLSDAYSFNSRTGSGFMNIDSSGNLLVGTTSTIIATSRKLQVEGTTAAVFKGVGAGSEVINVWQTATTGNNVFIEFDTEASITARGTITYNRGAGLVAYNTTSDYRAKDIIGPVENSGALIDSTPVYMGKMKGATQERPMFIAHEVPAYAHTGVKDAVDADGNPVYQQMDASALIPVMWAEIQSLRQRLATLESA